VDQINTAVSQMDKVTQQNAANAEESASASQELSTQAEAMNQVVNQLVFLVNGSSTVTGPYRRDLSVKSHQKLTEKKQHLTHLDHAFGAIKAESLEKTGTILRSPGGKKKRLSNCLWMNMSSRTLTIK
ncbi:MAG: hypothetical protein JXB18_09935, partial [Sedimentisphaerales bacterium]|nr:hypothetical protein [Sedimentisphaerales bacterium]